MKTGLTQIAVGKVTLVYYMNKYLIILAGSPRGGETTYSAMYKNVKDYLGADLAVCTTEDMYDNKISLFEKSDYQWILKKYNNFFEYYEEHFSGNWREYFDMGKGTGLFESGSIHFIFKDFILRNYLGILKKYEFVIYTRFDQFYLGPHIEGNSAKILIPSGEDYFGVCDRHAVVPKKYIEKFLNICEYINLPSSLNYDGKYLNCETAFLHHLEYEGIAKDIVRYSRTQFTSSKKEDKTNWRIPKYKIYFFQDLWIKYPDEFIDSCKNLRKNNYLFSFLFNHRILALNYYYLILRRYIGRLKIKT